MLAIIRSCKTSLPHPKCPTNFGAAPLSSFRRAAGNKQSAAPPLFPAAKNGKKKWGKLVVRGCGGEEKSGERRTFLSLEEAGLVEISGLSTHERFLCRLTISSLNLLRVVSEQEGLPIEELNAGRVCDWFLKDKLKREQNLDSAVLQWDDSGFRI